MAGIHQHPVEVPGEIQGAILVRQIDHSYPSTEFVFTSLIVEIQVDKVIQQPGACIFSRLPSSFAGFRAACLRAINVCKPDPDEVFSNPAIVILDLNIGGVTIHNASHSACSLIR
jgi:hypothetical protein